MYTKDSLPSCRCSVSPADLGSIVRNNALDAAMQVAGASAGSQPRAAMLPVPLFTVFDAAAEEEDGAQPPDGPRAKLQHFPKVAAHPRAALFC